MDLWKKFSIFGVIPILVACHYQAGLIPGSSNVDHSKRPPFVKYEHLRIRTKVGFVSSGVRFNRLRALPGAMLRALLTVCKNTGATVRTEVGVPPERLLNRAPDRHTVMHAFFRRQFPTSLAIS